MTGTNGTTDRSGRSRNAKLRLTGNPGMTSQLGELEHPKAVLCRTNAETMSQAMSAMDEGRRAGLVGGGATVKRMAEAAQKLQSGKKTDHGDPSAASSLTSG